jgi:hypothetical protein
MPTSRIDSHFIAASFIATLGLSTAEALELPAYPQDYRDWTHVKSMVIHPGHPLAEPFQGIHHVYANAAARDGLTSGSYSDGAAIAFDLLEYDTADNASTEGERVLLGVMVKDSSRYRETGGWGFEAWQGDSRTAGMVNDAGASCFSCHERVAERDYVFTQWRN